MRLPQPNSTRGVALIIVMLVITVLAILAGAFSYAMRVEATLGRNTSYDAEFEWLGRSGVELARYVVGQQLTIPNEPYDALNQKWAGSAAATNELWTGISLDNVPLGAGSFSVKIVDQERKCNINVADEATLRLALTLVGVEGGEQSTIVDSILDWRDPDDNPRPSGAESDYYLGMKPPYMCKNGPLDDLSELLLIRGVMPEMYFGSSALQPAPRVSATGRSLDLVNKAAPFYTNALAQMFTTVSARLINLNTASEVVLQLIPGIDANIAHGIVAHRAGPDGAEGTEDDVPFRNVGELATVPGLGQQAVANAARVFTVRSATFEVNVTVNIGGHARELVALIYRNGVPNDVRVLNTYWK